MRDRLDRDKYLMRDEIKKLREFFARWAAEDLGAGRSTGVNAWMVVDLAMSTGLRVKELAATRIEHIDWGASTMRVVRAKKKEKRRVQVSIGAALLSRLKDYIGERTAGPVFLGQQSTSADPGWRLSWDLSVNTELRAKEIAGMRLEDIDWQSCTVAVVRVVKTEPRPEEIPLNPALLSHLKAYVGDRKAGAVIIGQRGPLTRRGWQLAWLSACRRAGIRKLSIHKARHTYGTVMYAKTHDLRLVQVLLGHSSPSITQIYAHVDFEQLQEATRKVYEDQ